jgi:hypothetical protein
MNDSEFEEFKKNTEHRLEHLERVMLRRTLEVKILREALNAAFQSAGMLIDDVSFAQHVKHKVAGEWAKACADFADHDPIKASEMIKMFREWDRPDSTGEP